MKTIKQIADELGVSKQAVQKRISREPLYTKLHMCIHLKDGTKYIDDNGVKLVFNSFGKGLSIDASIDASMDKPPDTYIDIHSDVYSVVALLKDEIEAKNKLIEAHVKQLEEQQRSISSLTTALENTTSSLQAAQALHGGTMQQQIESSEQKKVRWWNRMRN